MKKIGILLAAVALFSGFMSPPKTISLFNGKDLTGWTVYGTEKWYVDNGELVCESGPDKEYGYLATDKYYKNFDLTLQFLQESKRQQRRLFPVDHRRNKDNRLAVRGRSSGTRYRGNIRVVRSRMAGADSG